MTEGNDQIEVMTSAVRKIGDSWTLLIIWAACQGVTRFDTFQRKLGVARNILSNRLGRLVDNGILEKCPVHTGARRQEYRITEKGEALRPLLTSIERWGAKESGENGHAYRGPFSDNVPAE